jgi:hypothetical protein
VGLRPADIRVCTTATTPTIATTAAIWSSGAEEVAGNAVVAIGDMGMWRQPLSVLANAGPARVIMAAIAAATARINFIRLIIRSPLSLPSEGIAIECFTYYRIGAHNFKVK